MLLCLPVVCPFLTAELELHGVHGLHLVYPRTSCWTWGCSQFLAVIDISKSAVNTHVQVVVWTEASALCALVPGSKVAQVKGKCTFYCPSSAPAAAP